MVEPLSTRRECVFHASLVAKWCRTEKLCAWAESAPSQVITAAASATEIPSESNPNMLDFKQFLCRERRQSSVSRSHVPCQGLRKCGSRLLLRLSMGSNRGHTV